MSIYIIGMLFTFAYVEEPGCPTWKLLIMVLIWPVTLGLILKDREQRLFNNGKTIQEMKEGK